jgi:hypothetical protein
MKTKPKLKYIVVWDSPRYIVSGYVNNTPTIQADESGFLVTVGSTEYFRKENEIFTTEQQAKEYLEIKDFESIH